MALVSGTLALADADSYRSTALADASRFVAEKKRESLSAEVRAGTITEKLGLSRFYKAGDKWVVAVSRVSPGMVHDNDSAATHLNVYLDPVFYEFRVLRVDNGEEAQVKVTQLGGAAQAVTIKINNRMKLVADMSATDIQSFATPVPTGFDAFPIMLPDFGQAHLTSESVAQHQIPRSLAHLPRHQLVAGQSIAFESPDLFARPVRVVWQRGDLWPTEIESASGYSVLVRQEKL